MATLLLLIFVSGVADCVSRPLAIDSLIIHDEREDSLLSARNQQFFDTLQMRSRRSKMGTLFYDLLVKKRSTDSDPKGLVVDESNRYKLYEGMKIQDISIEVFDPFDTAGTWIERAANKIHMTTRTRVIRRDLFFKVGDRVDAEEMVRQLQLLRDRKYISEVDIFIEPIAEGSDEVRVKVLIIDSWTISVTGSLGSGGSTMVGLSDANFLGCGTKVEVQTNFSRRTFEYGGNIVKFDAPNLFGSFYHAAVSVGRDFSETEVKLSLEKPLLLPTDYSLGADGYEMKEDKSFVAPDTLLDHHKYLRVDVWAGGALEIKPLKSSIYMLARYDRYRFQVRPTVSPKFNPYYHDGEELLVSLGLYREKFYTTNMLFGYGSREYIPTGYRAELLSGYRWGEFRDDYYIGARLMMGNFHSPGFFFANLSFGSYLSADGADWYQSTFNTNLRWFSNLWQLTNVNLRQFASLNYTVGWNRGRGYEETLDFDFPGELRALDESYDGLTRFVFSSETDVFTPFQPWGFRVTMYGFVDMGTLGFSSNPFKNRFCTSLGVGVRIKNEHLIFSAIQIQLGVSFGKGGLFDSKWIEISNQHSIPDLRYMPTKPEQIPFE